jgi:hypothetical protein
LPGASFPDLAGELALGLAVASPAPAAAQPAQAPLAPRTARSGLALTLAQQATDTCPHLFLSITLEPASRSFLRYDAAIAAWQKQEEADRGKASAGKAKT